MSMLERVVKEKALYFSYDYNLTQSAQTVLSRYVDEEAKVEEIKNDHDTFWSGVDTNYVFNYTALNFKNMNANLFVPCVYGYTYIHCVHFDQKKVEYVLISRKDCR